jgi:hypothetical protein
MKVNPQQTNLTLPVAAATAARLYPLLKPARTNAGYDASGVIDTVEIRRGNFQALPANRQVKYPAPTPAGKGTYIDLWA